MVRVRIIVLTTVLLACLVANGQVFYIDVRIAPPPPNSLHWDDIWNITIENPIELSGVPSVVDIHAELEMNGKVFSAFTEPFSIIMGTTVLNPAIAKTKNITFEFEDPIHQKYFRQNNEMMDGFYQMCVTLNFYGPGGNILYTANNCIVHEVSHPGIIILNTPMNGDTVESELLQFNWTHVTEGVPNLEAYYLLDLVTVRNGQANRTAISANPKRLSVDNLQEPYMDYPQIERALDTGQVYAWRVIAYTETNSTTRDKTGNKMENKNGGNFQEIARSDVGYFICGRRHSEEAKLKSPKTKYYIDLQHYEGQQTYIFSSFLPLSLQNPYAHRTLQFRLTDDLHNAINLPNRTVSLEPGLNNIEIDLSSDLIKAEQYYFAEVKISDEEVYLLKLYKEKKY